MQALAVAQGGIQAATETYQPYRAGPPGLSALRTAPDFPEDRQGRFAGMIRFIAAGLARTSIAGVSVAADTKPPAPHQARYYAPCVPMPGVLYPMPDSLPNV